MKKLRAFTLFEVLLSVGLLGGLFALSLPVMQSFGFRNEIQTAQNNAISALRTAQLNSQASLLDSQWGVRIQSGSIVVFRGASYGARDANEDQVYQLNSSIFPSGVSEVVFTKIFGTTANTGTITFTREGNSISFSINDKGTISF